MKNQITITQDEFKKAVKDALDYMEQAVKNDSRNSDPMVNTMVGFLFSAFAVKLTLILFQDNETLEIEENSK